MPRSEADEDASPDDADSEAPSRKGRLSKSLKKNRRKRKKPDAFDTYQKFVWFYTRSESAFVDWFGVLEAGMAWDVGDFGKLSREEFSTQNEHLLRVYNRLCSDVPAYKKDFYELEHDDDSVSDLAKQLNDAVTAARGADIASLRDKGIHYVELEQPNQNLTPKLNISTPKSTTRGHYHPVLSRFLCPVEYLKDFDADPEETQRKLRNNEVRITANSFPALLYANNEYDSDDPENGLLRNRVLVRFFKHIFTSPLSASIDDLMTSSSKRKIKRPQAQLNRMKQVTPGSIVYSALMFRHCISALDDWRTEDDLFNCEDFSTSLLSLFEDPEDLWAKDTLAWWNNHIFGTLTANEEENHEPSTIDKIRAKRAARVAPQHAVEPEHHNNERGTTSLQHDKDGHSQPPMTSHPAPRQRSLQRSSSRSSRIDPAGPASESLRKDRHSVSHSGNSYQHHEHHRSHSRISRGRQRSHSRSSRKRRRSRSESSLRRSRSRSLHNRRHSRSRTHQRRQLRSGSHRSNDRQVQSSPARPSHTGWDLLATESSSARRNAKTASSSSHAFSRVTTGHRQSSQYSPYSHSYSEHRQEDDELAFSSPH